MCWLCDLTTVTTTAAAATITTTTTTTITTATTNLLTFFSYFLLLASPLPPSPSWCRLDGQDERICLTVKCDGEGHNVELEKEGGDAALVPPLNHCVRTCWPKASIHWNGSEPRL